MTSKEWEEKMKQEEAKFLRKFGKYINKNNCIEKCPFIDLAPKDTKVDFIRFIKEEDRNKKEPFCWEL